MAAAGSFAAISTVFGSPVIGAVILLEAAALGGGGPTLSVVLLPGLIAAGLGSLVFIGMGDWTGLSTSAWALSPLDLPPYDGPDWGDFAWTIVLAIAAALVVFVIVEVARLTTRLVSTQPFVLTVAAALVVGGLPSPSTRRPINRRTRCCSRASTPSKRSSRNPSLSLSTLTLLLVFKGLAWSISLGNFRGGPTFPALFLGTVAGLLAADLPGFSETPAVAALMAAACVSILRLPLASVVIALLLTSQAGLTVAPLIIVTWAALQSPQRATSVRAAPTGSAPTASGTRTSASGPWDRGDGRTRPTQVAMPRG